MKRIYFVVIGMLTLLPACQDKSSVSEDLCKVKTVEAVPASADATLSFPAKVVSDNKVNVSFKVAGRILLTNVEEGVTVRAGQLIATLDPRDYQIAFDAVQAEYNSVKSEADRVIALYGDSATSAVNYDKAVFGLQQITAKLDHARDQLADTKIYAPVSGTVKTVYRRAGEVVGAGTPVAEIVDDGRPVVEIKIPASDYIRRADFVDFTCRFDVYPGHVFHLRPLSVSSVANANQLYTFKLSFVGNEGPLPSVGMTTSVEIFVNAGSDDSGAWVLPAAAVAGEGTEAHVYIIRPDSLITRVPVSVDRLTGNGEVIIYADQSLAGETIVGAGARSLHDGQKVVAIKRGSRSNVGGLL